MMKSSLFLLLSFSAVGALNASPVACSTGTVQTYTTTVNSDGGCTESNLLFNQFNYTTTASGTAISLPASAVAVSPLLNAGGAGFGFQIVGGFAATSGGLADGIFQYEVSTVDNSATLTGISLTFNGTATGTGIANVSENYCVDGTTVPPANGCGTGLKNIFVQSTNGSSSLSNSATFGGATSVTVSKDIVVNGGTSGTATISSVTNQFQTGSGPSSVPEPATLSLVGGAMFLIGAFRYRRAKARS